MSCKCRQLLEFHNCSGHGRRLVIRLPITVPCYDQPPLLELYDACATLGVSLPVLTFPGENPNRPLSSVSGSAFSTASSTSSSFTSSTSHISQTTISSLASPIPTISQSTVTALPSSTPLPAAPSTSRSSARKPEGVVDLRMMMMMIGSLIAGSLLV